MPKEPYLQGVLHIAIDGANNHTDVALCDHMVRGAVNGQYQTSMNDFISRESNSHGTYRYTHCHMCEALVSDFDIINATEV